MPYTREQKDAAARNQDKVNAAAIAAGMAGSASAIAPVVGPFVAAGCGVVAGALALRGIWQGKKVRDPARWDFDVETTVGPVRFDISDFAESAIETGIADLVSVTDELTRLVEAEVTAVERSDGARAADEYAIARLRTGEAVGFAQAISQRLYRSSNLVRGLAIAIGDTTGPFANSPILGSTEISQSFEDLAIADEEWANEIRQSLQFGWFLEGLEGTGSPEGSPS